MRAGCTANVLAGTCLGLTQVAGRVKARLKTESREQVLSGSLRLLTSTSIKILMFRSVSNLALPLVRLLEYSSMSTGKRRSHVDQKRTDNITATSTASTSLTSVPRPDSQSHPES